MELRSGVWTPDPVLFTLLHTPSPAHGLSTSFLAPTQWGTCSSGPGCSELGLWSLKGGAQGRTLEARSPTAVPNIFSFPAALPAVGLGPLARRWKEALTAALPSSCPPHGAQWSGLLLARCLAISRIRGLGLIARKASLGSPGSKS